MRPFVLLVAACFALAPLEAKPAPGHHRAHVVRAAKKKTAKRHRASKRHVNGRRAA